MTAVQLCGGAGSVHSEDGYTLSGRFTSIHVPLGTGMAALDVIRRRGGRIGPSLICPRHGVIHIICDPVPAAAWTGVPDVLRTTDDTTDCGHHWSPRLWLLPTDMAAVARTDPETLLAVLTNPQN